VADGAAVSAADLVAFVKAELGSVKAPKTIHFVAELPRNAAGKVSRAAVRSMLGG
jgi:acyl-coenzyme A synthetase/AMP-(fatty) acid ligase